MASFPPPPSHQSPSPLLFFLLQVYPGYISVGAWSRIIGSRDPSLWPIPYPSGLFPPISSTLVTNPPIPRPPFISDMPYPFPLPFPRAYSKQTKFDFTLNIPCGRKSETGSRVFDHGCQLRQQQHQRQAEFWGIAGHPLMPQYAMEWRRLVSYCSVDSMVMQKRHWLASICAVWNRVNSACSSNFMKLTRQLIQLNIELLEQHNKHELLGQVFQIVCLLYNK